MTQSMPEGVVTAAREGAIGWVVIDNPARRNALSAEMMRTLARAVEDFDARSDVRMIAIRGAGDAVFASGADIRALEARGTSAEAQVDYDSAVDAMFSALTDAATPILAMIHGVCFGAGMAIALAADIRFGDEASLYSIPAARMGIGYPLALTRRLVAVVGPGNAAEILFGAGRLDAQTAQRIGLLNRVTTAASLESEVAGFGASLAANAPLTIRAAKLSIAAALDVVDDHTALEAIDACMRSQDALEGPIAFREKRAPRFTGR
ncbi:enoyl-CoA hydratase-related protein [Agromyces sp. SYSU T00266]|uniref:enoyl-CoA hydratase-related protein n=1 Tax=Agromyces zhanjiangensis TaxID=3158562 RepID=UPI003395CF7B